MAPARTLVAPAAPAPHGPGQPSPLAAADPTVLPPPRPVTDDADKPTVEEAALLGAAQARCSAAIWIRPWRL